MKKLLLTLLLTFFAVALYAQTNLFYPTPGKVAEYTVKISSPMGDQQMISIQQSQITDGILEVKNEIKENADSPAIQSVNIKYQDKGDYYLADLREVLQSTLASLGDFTMEMLSGELRFPKTMKVGDTYPDVKAKVSANVQGMALSMDMLMSGRSVQVKETIEVPAGKFECFRFVEKTTITVMGQEQVSEMTSWFSPGVGLVKQKGSAQNGMINSDTELKSIR